MSGLVCLQGGGEFSTACRDMDRALAARGTGPVVVTALAGEVGHDYATATANGVAHLASVTDRTVVGAPDVRQDPAAALEVLATASLLVLPGGSPSRLLSALTDTPAGALLAELVAAGTDVMGASAGAMVLCPWTVLPDRRGAGAVSVARGLGLVPGLLVVPHWSGGSSRGDWLQVVRDQVPDDLEVLGLPEESGVLVEDGALTAVGQRPARLVSTGRDLPVGESWTRP